MNGPRTSPARQSVEIAREVAMMRQKITKKQSVAQIPWKVAEIDKNERTMIETN